MSQEALNSVKAKLEQGGYSGLYRSGECGCELSDLAPCGECRADKDGYINGCRPGYKHVDPRSRFNDFAVTDEKEMPTEDEFDSIFASC